MKFLTSISIVAFSLIACASSLKDAPETVDSVDLERYQGKWYEIVKIPNNFQEDCVSDVTAEYSSAEDGLLKVVNSCVRENGKAKSSEGRARIEDPVTNARLKVTFAKMFGKWIFAFGGDYWIIELAEDYSTVVVGHPQRKFGWILSRTPALNTATLKELSERLVSQGYNPCEFISGKQSGGLHREVSLCELVE